jgi:hypothetical protein
VTNETWDSGTPGLLRLPSGLLVRGRGLRNAFPAGQKPEFGVYLQGKEPAPFDWESRWVLWKDFWLPSDREGFVQTLRELLKRAETERVGSPALAVPGVRAQQCPALRFSTAFQPTKLSHTCARNTHAGPSRPPGRNGSSLGSHKFGRASRPVPHAGRDGRIHALSVAMTVKPALTWPL